MFNYIDLVLDCAVSAVAGIYTTGLLGEKLYVNNVVISANSGWCTFVRKVNKFLSAKR